MPSIRNILLIGSFGTLAIENFLKRGFERKGVGVSTFEILDPYYAAINKNLVNKIFNKISPDIFYKDINRQLITFTEKKKYDVILVFKGMELFPETIEQLKRHTPILANYNCDHPFKFYSAGSGNSNVRRAIKTYDIHFSYSKNITRQLRSDFDKEAYCIPFGFDSDNVSLNGSASLDCTGRFLFIGAYDKPRATYLERLKTDKLDIYGDVKWKTRNFFRPYVLKSYRQRQIHGNKFASAIHTSTGVINLLREQNLLERSHNMKTFEVPGYGGLLISQRTEEQSEFFEEDKEAVFFDSMDELKEKMIYLSRNHGVVEKIKQAAYERSVRSRYGYNERSTQMLECLQLHFK